MVFHLMEIDNGERVRITIDAVTIKRVCICINNTYKTVNEITQTINYTIL